MKKIFCPILTFLFFIVSSVFSQSGWVQLNSGTTADIYCASFFNAETGFVVGQGGLILRTTNGGLNWTTISSGTSGIITQITFPDTLTGYYLDDINHLGKTTNAGINWSLACTFGPQSIQTMFFVDALNGHVGGYWGGYPEGWWLKTTNGGTNWAGACLCQQYIRAVFFPSLLVGYIGTGTNFVGYPTLRKTTNSGVSWSSLPIGITNTTNINSIYFFDEYTGYFGVSDGRIFKTINGGNNWTSLTFTGHSINNVHIENLFTGYFVTGNSSNGSVFRTNNSGNNWSESIVTSGGAFRWVHFVNTLTGYAVGDNGKIFKTTVGGENVPAAPKNLNVNAISSSKMVLNWEDKSFNETGFKIFRSTNAGVNWLLKDSTMQNAQDYVDSGLVANNVYYYRVCAFNIVGNSFYSQIDWDTTYIGIPPAVTLNYLKITVDKPVLPVQNVFDTNIITLPYTVPLFTTDVEITIDTMIGNNIGAMEFVLNHLGIYDTIIYHVGGTGSNFIETTLDDSALVPISGGTPPFTGRFKPSRPLAQFKNIDPRGLWLLNIYSSSKSLTGVIKSWGITVTYNNPISKISRISSETPDRFRLFQNYPNPFNPNTIIRFQIRDLRFVNLKVYDILGREVETLINENLKTGTYEIPFSIDQCTNNRLPSGIYFYKLTAGNFTEIKKMVLLK
jgi:photosystem II stability/assembly factor-like uncharacterized protein